VSRRPTSVEHAATTLALVAALPMLPFRKRSRVGLLTSAFRANRRGLTSLARNHRSNGESNRIRIERTLLAWHERGGRVAAGGEKQRENVRSIIIPRLRQEGHEELQLCRFQVRSAASRHKSHILSLSPRI